MPPVYVAIHFLLALAVWGSAWWLPVRSRLRWPFGAGLLTLTVGGMLLERRTDWAWSAMGLGWPDLVFFTNLTLEGTAVLLLLLWRQAAGRAGRLRAGLLTLLALGAALWSYRWYFEPVPAGLAGAVDRTGYCRQTSDDSCSAAAAVMVLHAHGIRATEAEMAALCLTRSGHGTTPMGLFRGLAVKSQRYHLRPVLRRAGTVSGLAALGSPGIVSIGLGANAPPATAKRLEEYGWQAGVRHAVVVLNADPAGKWLDVADPSYGRERWPTSDPEELRYLWDGAVLVMR